MGRVAEGTSSGVPNKSRINIGSDLELQVSISRSLVSCGFFMMVIFSGF